MLMCAYNYTQNLEAEYNKIFAASKTSPITWIWNAGNFSTQSKIFRTCFYYKVENRKNILMTVEERKKNNCLSRNKYTQPAWALANYSYVWLDHFPLIECQQPQMKQIH